MNAFRVPLKHNAVFLVWRAALLLAAFGVAACFTPGAFGQGLARQDGSVPVPMDWSSKHVLFTPGSTKKQAAKILKEPRASDAAPAQRYKVWHPPSTRLQKESWPTRYRMNISPCLEGPSGMRKALLPELDVARTSQGGSLDREG